MSLLSKTYSGLFPWQLATSSVLRLVSIGAAATEKLPVVVSAFKYRKLAEPVTE